MKTKIWKKGEAIAAIALLLFGALLIASSASALTVQTGNISFVVIYKDVKTGDTDFLSGEKVNLYDADGNLVKTAYSNPFVEFTGVPYGKYSLKIDARAVSGYVYGGGYATIKLDSTGVHTLTGSSFTNITVDRYPLENTMHVNLTNGGTPIEGDVYVYFQGTLIANATVYGDFDYLANGSTNFSVPTGTVLVKVVYNDGGVEKMYYREVTVTTSNISVNIDVSAYYKIWGVVWDSETGYIVNKTIRITLINKTTGAMWKTMSFTGGAFSFYVSNLNYKVVITADGYSIYSGDATTTMMNVYLTPISNDITYTLDFSYDMRYMNLTYVAHISNETRLLGLPHNDIGVLYYQLKALGWTSTDLKTYLTNMVYNYTSQLVSVDGEIYELESYTPTWTVVNAATETYTLTITATYKNTDINKDSLLSDGYINVVLKAKKDAVVGAHRVYTYYVAIPSDLERSNKISTANVTGYINTIEIKEVKATPVTIMLKERKSPEMMLDTEHFIFGWQNISLDNNYVVNQSADNYTIVVPAYKSVWYNASKVVYDVVREVTDPENTTFAWYVDGVLVTQGKGAANFTHTLSKGKHTIMIKATDVGNNTNETNITVLADAAWPTVNISLKAPDGSIIGEIYASNSSIGKIEYNISGKTGSVWRNATTHAVVIPVNLVINESEEVVYDATSTVDTYDGKNLTHLPVMVEWDFNGNKSTGLNRTYAFDVPSRNGPYTVNVTISDAVNNTIIISFKVEVRDITKPVVKLNITVNGTLVSEVKEEENVTLDASGSYDPENGTIVSYNWTIEDSDYKVVNLTAGVYDLIEGSFNSDKIVLRFHKYGTYYILLNVTDAAGNYYVLNRTLRVLPVRPDLAINSVDIIGDRVAGAQLTFKVNVTNNGNKEASVYYIAIIVDGKTIANKSYTDLPSGGYAIQEIKVSLGEGNHTVKIKVYCPDEPSSYYSDNEKTEQLTIQPAPWVLPAEIGGAIAVILIVAYLGYKFSERKKGHKKFKKKSKKKEEKE